MLLTVPAIHARMGSTDYFQAVVRVRDLAGIALTAGELEEWKQWSLIERFQREVSQRRIEREIVPYLVKSRDRFFGSLIILVYEPEVFEFECLAPRVKVGRAYADSVRDLGVLTIEGGKLVALDGQHRLVALRSVVQGSPYAEGPFRKSVADDQLSILFVLHETLEKTRRIFNKVNRYAKPTNPTDNIITSEDDGYSIVTRWLVEPEPPLDLTEPRPPLHLPFGDEGLVEWRSQQIEHDRIKLTTLHTVYQTVQSILDANGIANFDERHRVNRPSDDELAVAYLYAAEWWSQVLTGIDGFSVAVRHPRELPELRRRSSPYSLILRPIGQVALFEGLKEAYSWGVSLKTAVRRANKLDWRAENSLWFGTIIHPNGRMITRKESIRLGARLIAYLVGGGRFDTTERRKLQRDLREQRDDPRFVLPTPVT